MDILWDVLPGLSEDGGGGYGFWRIADGCK